MSVDPWLIILQCSELSVTVIGLIMNCLLVPESFVLDMFSLSMTA